ncbi:MAG TPA: GNAT family N-acyltransferase [Opitutaceae bacterium]|nr:GNAT family N-acyltransferase [Opitutaceae bacterium]
MLPTALSEPSIEGKPGFPFVTDRYRVRLATCEADLRSAQRLRFEVFNKELHEGLESAWLTGHDQDRFDAACAHLLVEENSTGAIVGTYRMLPGPVAASSGLGYYSAQEFDFAPFEPFRREILELGRACVHQDHRNQTVVGILWRGIAIYARSCGARYLIGCSSLTSQDPAEGAAVYRQLTEKYLAPAAFRTQPMPSYSFLLPPPDGTSAKIPRLMAAYLMVGCRICGEPAIDREFKTIDFLTLMDIENVPAAVARKYLI